jgi:hypothetical protein
LIIISGEVVQTKEELNTINNYKKRCKRSDLIFVVFKITINRFLVCRFLGIVTLGIVHSAFNL